MPPAPYTSYFSKIQTFLVGLRARLLRISWRDRKTQTIAFVVLVSVLGIAFLSKTGPDSEPSAPALRAVELVAVAEFSRAGPAPASDSEEKTFVVRAETSGKVTRVAASGVAISAGSVIAEIENAAQRAALLQAEGALEAARAAEKKTTGGLRPEQISIRETGLESAKNSAVTALLSAYAAIDSAVDDTADQLFSGIETGAPDLIFFSTNKQRETELERTRSALNATLARIAVISKTIRADDALEAEIARAEEEVRTARSFIDTLLAALNDGIPSNGFSSETILSYKASVGSERTTLTAALSSLTSARAALATAKKTLEEGEDYSQETDLSAASAAVKQAQGAYASALAAYQKTIIRAGGKGTVLSCSAAVGDILSFGADVCRIKGSGAIGTISFDLPLSAVKYTPLGAFVFVIDDTSRVRAIEVETGLVTARGILVTGLTGEEKIVRDVRGLVDGEEVTGSPQS